MAWTEQCKIDAKNQVQHLKKNGMSAKAAIEKLSDESGIPYGTIERWIYPRKKSYGRNDVTETPEQAFIKWRVHLKAFLREAKYQMDRAYKGKRLDILEAMHPMVLEIAQCAGEVHLLALAGEASANEQQKATATD